MQAEGESLLPCSSPVTSSYPEHADDLPAATSSRPDDAHVHRRDFWEADCTNAAGDSGTDVFPMATPGPTILLIPSFFLSFLLFIRPSIRLSICQSSI